MRPLPDRVFPELWRREADGESLALRDGHDLAQSEGLGNVDGGLAPAVHVTGIYCLLLEFLIYFKNSNKICSRQIKFEFTYVRVRMRVTKSLVRFLSIGM